MKLDMDVCSEVRKPYQTCGKTIKCAYTFAWGKQMTAWWGKTNYTKWLVILTVRKPYKNEKKYIWVHLKFCSMQIFFFFCWFRSLPSKKILNLKWNLQLFNCQTIQTSQLIFNIQTKKPLDQQKRHLINKIQAFANINKSFVNLDHQIPEAHLLYLEVKLTIRLLPWCCLKEHFWKSDSNWNSQSFKQF